MFNSTILDVAIGLVLLYALLSLMATAIRESIEAVMKYRASNLERGLMELLEDDGKRGALLEAFYQHPLIAGLYRDRYPTKPNTGGTRWSGHSLPSYIPSRSFAIALLDLCACGGNSKENHVLDASLVRFNINKIQSDDVKRVVLTALDITGDDIEKTIRQLENWFDAGMDRASGWYRRNSQYWLLAIGISLAALLNVDTVKFAKSIYANQVEREYVIDRAKLVLTQNDANAITAKDASKILDAKNLPIGWTDESWPKDFLGGTGRIIGWILTGIAVTLGAPFWFDLLNRFMVIRSTVKPLEKGQEEGSEDRLNKHASTGNDGTGAASNAAAAHDEPIDGCDISASPGEQTSDEDLPASSGGVAR